MEELESYAKQTEEFSTFGDMNEIQRYLRKAQALDAKLQAAAEKIEAFNAEEEAFGWQTTTYPNRLSTINTLKPFLQLYELTVDFNEKFKYVIHLINILLRVFKSSNKMKNAIGPIPGHQCHSVYCQPTICLFAGITDNYIFPSDASFP